MILCLLLLSSHIYINFLMKIAPYIVNGNMWRQKNLSFKSIFCLDILCVVCSCWILSFYLDELNNLLFYNRDFIKLILIDGNGPMKVLLRTKSIFWRPSRERRNLLRMRLVTCSRHLSKLHLALKISKLENMEVLKRRLKPLRGTKPF